MLLGDVSAVSMMNTTESTNDPCGTRTTLCSDIDKAVKVLSEHSVGSARNVASDIQGNMISD